MSNENRDEKYRFLFGPVPSRRLGLSLGVDLVPYKTCTMDCIYCESGRTTSLTLERSEFFPAADIISELDKFLSSGREIDFITFSGAGEPTLYLKIGEIIDFIKTNYPEYRTALLTNGMLLTDKKTFNDVKNVDLIVPSLDAPTEEIFRRINRPLPGIKCAALIDAFARFHRESTALFYLEIFIVPGINDTPESIEKFRDAIIRINPDMVQLNSLDRPGTEAWVPAAISEGMERVRLAFANIANVEIVGKFSSSKTSLPEKSPSSRNLDTRILELLSRRPCTTEDLQHSLNLPGNTVEKLLTRMLEKKLIAAEKRVRGIFYIPIAER